MKLWNHTLALAAALILAGGFPGTSRGQQTVDVGYDLLQTQGGTRFNLPCPGDEDQTVDFLGAPIGSFDFGAGPQDVGDTDTILLRRQPATEGGDGTDTIDVEVVALSLVSVAPVELCGGPSQQISLTLDAARTTALPNTGRMTIDFGSMTFTTPAGVPGVPPSPRLHYWVDVSGSVSGPITSLEQRLRFVGNLPWQRQAATGALLVDGVNHLLNGVDESTDFFPQGSVIADSEVAWHRLMVTGPAVRAPALGTPAAALLTGLLLAMLAWGLCRAESRRRSEC